MSLLSLLRMHVKLGLIMQATASLHLLAVLYARARNGFLDDAPRVHACNESSCGDALLRCCHN